MCADDEMYLPPYSDACIDAYPGPIILSHVLHFESPSTSLVIPTEESQFRSRRCTRLCGTYLRKTGGTNTKHWKNSQ